MKPFLRKKKKKKIRKGHGHLPRLYRGLKKEASIMCKHCTLTTAATQRGLALPSAHSCLQHPHSSQALAESGRA